jgi:transcriptional regulator with XRE-family HTH domain
MTDAEGRRIPDVPPTLAELVRTARRRRGLGLNQLAMKARVDKSWLSRIEAGKTKRPRDRDGLVRLARALDLDMDDVEEAMGTLTPEEKQARGERLGVEDAIRDDRRLTDDNRRLLLDMYRTLVGEPLEP